MRLTFDRLRAAERYTTTAPDCLDELSVAAAADGAATPRAIEHLSRCAACRGQVAHLARLLGDAAVAREVSRLEGRGLRRLPAARVLAGLAAAAVLALAVLPSLPRTDGADEFRDVRPAASAPVLDPPLASAGGLESLRWSSVEGATQYRVTVFDEEGGLVWSSETVDTTIAFPADTALDPGTPYWWRVEARVDFDRWTASELGTFTMERQRPRP